MHVSPLRLSTLFVRTLRDDPAHADVRSHRLLLRAGYIRRTAPGIYTYLPLGLMVLRNVERIIREEMVRAGCQEVLFPALLPREPFDVTGRWSDYGPELFRLHDRRGSDYLLGPTHEEMFTLLVDDICTSYKDLPLSIFQIQTKYRDEARPRAGLLRGREFVMKDSYSFDLDDEGLARSYQTHRDAYIRTFDRLGLPYVIVTATSGAMGGSASEEFLAPLDAGEDTFAQCRSCGRAANIEATETRSGDACASCGGPLDQRRGIEIGHIFQLGRRYAEALGLEVLGPGGHGVTPTMGSYGIGVSRAVAAIAEATSDDQGLCWPPDIAPARVHVAALGKGVDITETADALVETLSDAGVHCLYDDRLDVSAGVKLKDAELLGIPLVVVVGKGLTEGTIEFRDRMARTVEHLDGTTAADEILLRLADPSSGRVDQRAST